MCSCFWLPRPFLVLSSLLPLPLSQFTSHHGSVKVQDTLFPCLKPLGHGHRSWLGQFLFPPGAGTGYRAGNTKTMRWLDPVRGDGGTQRWPVGAVQVASWPSGFWEEVMLPSCSLVVCSCPVSCLFPKASSPASHLLLSLCGVVSAGGNQESWLTVIPGYLKEWGRAWINICWMSEWNLISGQRALRRME